MSEGCWEPEAFCYGKEGRHFESGRKGFKLSIEQKEMVLLNPPDAREHLSPGHCGSAWKSVVRRAGQGSLEFDRTVAQKQKAAFP